MFPQIGPVSADNMNYCSAAFGIVGLVSLVTWVVDGRKHFTGPETQGVGGVVVEETAGEEKAAGKGLEAGVKVEDGLE